MLPGTYAFVGTGQVGKAVFLEGSGSLNMELWQVGLAGGSCTLSGGACLDHAH